MIANGSGRRVPLFAGLSKVPGSPGRMDLRALWSKIREPGGNPTTAVASGCPNRTRSVLLSAIAVSWISAARGSCQLASTHQTQRLRPSTRRSDSRRDNGVGAGMRNRSNVAFSGERRVVATDVARAPLELASQAARQMGVEGILFVETDLRQPGLQPESFDVVCALGVLHHTPDPRASFASVSRLARPGGAVVVGLYNAFARFPHRLRRAVARASGFRWFPFDPILRARADEPSRREAWIRDQYRHPEEHRHTVREVKRWFAENGISYLRTVPDALLDASEEQNLFSPAEDSWGLEELLAQIGWMATLSHEGGLFIAIGRRPPLAGSLPARMSNER